MVGLGDALKDSNMEVAVSAAGTDEAGIKGTMVAAPFTRLATVLLEGVATGLAVAADVEVEVPADSCSVEESDEGDVDEMATFAAAVEVERSGKEEELISGSWGHLVEGVTEDGSDDVNAETTGNN